MELAHKTLLAVLILVFIITHSQPSGAQESVFFQTPERHTFSWTELIFEGSKFFSSLNVTIQHSFGEHFSHNPSGDRETALDDCTETDSESELLAVQFSSRVVGLSQGKYEEKIWFNRTAAHPYSRIRMSRDDTPWIKSYCWEEKGVRRRKIQPDNKSEIKEGPAKWTKHTEAFYMYPEKAAGCEMISDPSLVLVLLSSIEPNRQSGQYGICVFGKKQLHRLLIKEEKSSPLKVAYRERSSSRETTIEGQILPLVFSIGTENIAPDKAKPEIFSFLGLQKNIRIYVDPEKRLPVRISGTNNSIGRLVLDLKSHFK